MKPLIKITVIQILVYKHPKYARRKWIKISIKQSDHFILSILCSSDKKHYKANLHVILRVSGVPIGPLNTVTKQSDQILVPHTPDCFDLNLEFLFRLTPDVK